MPITYRPLTPADLPTLALISGDWILHTNVMHFEPGSLSLGAFHGKTPVGFISVYPRKLSWGKREAYIDVIEVARDHWRQGIATEMLAMSERWARSQGFSQIRAWSTVDKTEAIAMWRALGFRLRPVRSGRCKRGKLVGYYAAKPLRGELP